MKIFTRAQIKELDAYTIEHEPIKSVDLMERAAGAIADYICGTLSGATPVVVFAGAGNNGGDALAVARMLAERGFRVSAYLFNIADKLSDDCRVNRDRLLACGKTENFHEVSKEFDPPVLGSDATVIDGLFGSGLNRPLTGGFASLVKYINASPCKVISIDIPSGLMTEDNTNSISANIIRADCTLTLQQPKLAFLFAENRQYIGELVTLDIHLSEEGEASIDARYTITEAEDVRARMLPRDPFANKGMMGNALIVAGSYGMAGAAILAARACLRAGTGKVTVHTPKMNNIIMQTAVPEAVMHLDQNNIAFSESVDTEGFDAMGIGPGLGTGENTGTALITQLRRATCPTVVDADAINILARRKAWLQQLPKGVILTPHPKEFDRLEGPCANTYERITKGCALAERLEGYVIIKDKYSALCKPDGSVTFNPTGNAGMATAGSGDVLTGIITALLARGYGREGACITGMYLHGLAGDCAAKEKGVESLIASDIIDYLPQAFKALEH